MRLFVALYPPVERAAGMLEALASLQARRAWPAWRAVRADQVHLTLQFIGEVAGRELTRIQDSVTRAASGIGGFALAPMRLVTLPRPGRTPPRLIALETDAPPPLLELHRRLAGRLAHPPRGSLAVDKDHFLPHLTLARFNAIAPKNLAIDEPFVASRDAAQGASPASSRGTDRRAIRRQS